MSSARADFIVLARDLPDIQLIVEVQQSASSPAFERAFAQVTAFMRGVHSPLGLVVTPTRTWLLREAYEPDGTLDVHEYSTSGLLGLHAVPVEQADLEREVGHWLERLTRGQADGANPDIRREVDLYLIPSLLEGRVESGVLT